MSLSHFTRKAAVCWSLAASCTTLLTAQTAYQPLGSEQAVTGVIPGDQSHPSLAVNSAGGFLVWDDNVTDGQGFGVSAVALDTHLQAAQQPFRINVDAAGDQEYPRVALLKEGGAAFVWLGGQLGFQKVYARFLSKENTWSTVDVLVSSPNHSAKAAPALATLANGNVVVVWSTFNQRSSSSMQDVYGQLFKPTGEKLGGAFAINQFSQFNQRTPAVAARQDGGFIVAWISEQQRELAPATTNEFVSSAGSVSVDIYGRVYAPDATAGNEFLINDDRIVCANPSIATAQDGRFIMAWSQGKPESLTNSWDVVVRPFSALGVGGSIQQLNSYSLDNQFAPQLACLGNDFMAVWTSVRQDGSREGVFGQYLDADAHPVGGEFRVNTTRVMSQNQPALASDNFGRFLAAWRTASLEGKLTVELAAQTYAIPGFQPLAQATNYVGPVFAGGSADNGGNTENPTTGSGTPVLDFPLAPAGGPVLVDAFAKNKGSYQGLVYSKQGIHTQDSGFITAVTSARGGYTVNIKVGTRSYTLSGKLNADGRATYQKTRIGAAPVICELQLDMSGNDQLAGTFTDGQVTAEFLANRVAYNGFSSKYPNAGVYTFVIQPPTSGSAVPQGSGNGRIAINAAGVVTVVAKLADGTVITQTSSLSKDGLWPLYAAPYQNKGRFMGWIKMTSETALGDVAWIKPTAASKSYPAGFSAESKLIGSRYTRPGQGKRVLVSSNGTAEFTLSGGGLDEPLVLPVFLDLNNRIVDAQGTGLKAMITLGNGMFQGTFMRPADGKRIQFSGTLLQGDNQGAGFFLNNNLSGQVLLSPLQ